MKAHWAILAVLGLLCACTTLVRRECPHGASNVSQPAPKAAPGPAGRKISIRIMDQGGLTPATMRKVLKQHNPRLGDARIREIVQICLEECRAEGVNHDIAFAQMCLETGYLRFGGQVRAGQNNFCGLGATDGGSAGARFRSVRDGVRAQVQHLKAYASQEPLTNPCVDPRFRHVKRGSARTIYDLAGQWASDRRYGEKLKDRLLLFYRIQGGGS